MRPPRPWPSWRRAMSALIASGSSSRPAGSPSTMHVSPGPCDSPAVIRRSGTPARLGGAGLSPGARCGLRLEVGAGGLRHPGDHGPVGLGGERLEPAGAPVVAVAQGPVAGDPRPDDLATGARDAGEALAGLLRRRGDRLADLDHVE